MYTCTNVNQPIKYDTNVNKVQYHPKKDNFHMNKNTAAYTRLIVNHLTYTVGLSTDSKKSAGNDLIKSGFTLMRGKSSSALKFCRAFEIRLL